MPGAPNNTVMGRASKSRLSMSVSVFSLSLPSPPALSLSLPSPSLSPLSISLPPSISLYPLSPPSLSLSLSFCVSKFSLPVTPSTELKVGRGSLNRFVVGTATVRGKLAELVGVRKLRLYSGLPHGQIGLFVPSAICPAFTLKSV